MTSLDRRFWMTLVALLTSAVPGCWPGEPPELPPFDCANIDRAAERFPEECGDAGVNDDMGVPSDGGDDTGP